MVRTGVVSINPILLSGLVVAIEVSISIFVMVCLFVFMIVSICVFMIVFIVVMTVGIVYCYND